MKRFLLYMFLTCFSYQNVHTKPKIKNKDNSIIEIKTIDELLTVFTAKTATVVMGSMDACFFCKKAKPLFENKAKSFPDITFYITNGVRTEMARLVYEETNKKMRIQGYPAFIFIKDGKIQDYLVGARIEELERKIKLLQQDD